MESIPASFKVAYWRLVREQMSSTTQLLLRKITLKLKIHGGGEKLFFNMR
jgi:hypothetical protein